MMKVMKQITKPSFDFENKYSEQYQIIAGVDEVGRGALAGPIVAAAVVFKKYDSVINDLVEINDSKIVPAVMRLNLDELIKIKAYDFAIGQVSSLEIDKYGIGAANVMAFERALNGLKKCEFALIDG